MYGLHCSPYNSRQTGARRHLRILVLLHTWRAVAIKSHKKDALIWPQNRVALIDVQSYTLLLSVELSSLARGALLNQVLEGFTKPS